MLVHEIMTSPAYSLTSGSAVEEAARLMARAHITSVPVVDAERRVIGIVSEADILRSPLEPDPRAHLRPQPHPPGHRPGLVDQVMTPEPFTTVENADVADVARTFTASGWKSLPVVRDGRLVGMVSRSDVLRTLVRPDGDIRREVLHELGRFGQERWRVTVVEGEVQLSGSHSEREARMAESITAAVPGVRRLEVLLTNAETRGT